MNARILDTIKKSAAVPSIPQVVTRFLEIMQDPKFTYEDLVRALAADVGTVTDILRLVNSALFGVRQKILSLRQALTLLGPKRTRSLLLGRYLVDTLARKQVSGLDMSYFWRRSLATSVVAARFADSVLPRHRDEAFISALLADIGVSILAEAMPERYAALAAEYRPRGAALTAEQELAAVEVTHAQVSAMVLKHWGLPDVVTDAVNLHQSAHPGSGDAASIARLLHAADLIAKLLCELPEPDELTRVCVQATAIVGVEIHVLLNLLPTIESDIEELAGVLKVDVIPSKVYTIIARTMQEHLAAGVP